jgi:hypothetical protein
MLFFPHYLLDAARERSTKQHEKSVREVRVISWIVFVAALGVTTFLKPLAAARLRFRQ